MRNLGPAMCGTIVCENLSDSVELYKSLSMTLVKNGEVNQQLAEFWHAPATAGMKYAILASASDAAWVRLIEDPDAAKDFKPFEMHGWLSLEVSVNDVDKLALKLADSGFKIIGEPANLDVSDAIRAMQVQGPSGEVLYLTEVREKVPPFELPQAATEVDNLFIPVMITPSRDESADMFMQFDGLDKFEFDTKITVINRAYGYKIERKHPVAVIQLAESCMIELDQVDAAVPRQRLDGHLSGGIAMVTFMTSGGSAIALQSAAEFGRSIYARKQAGYRTGIAGEGIEVISAS